MCCKAESYHHRLAVYRLNYCRLIPFPQLFISMYLGKVKVEKRSNFNFLDGFKSCFPLQLSMRNKTWCL